MCEKNSSSKNWIKLGKILSRIDRVPFKLECSNYILRQVRKLEKPKTLTPDYRFKVELATDCFLAEIIGVMDSLLQEINDKMDLGVPREKVNEITVNKALRDITKLNKKQRKNILRDIWDIKNRNWLWLLKQYRNMAVHRSPLSFSTIFSQNMAEGIRFERIMLQPVEGDPDPREHEVISYLSNSLKKMRKMAKSIEENLS